tara:strand:+ start:685 stop:897 length:213 start_codon:yes stop_codon:yes gene_type:complete
MKLNELINSFEIQTSNEEKNLLDKMDSVTPLNVYGEREQRIIENLIRKSLVLKTYSEGNIMVVKNEPFNW